MSHVLAVDGVAYRLVAGWVALARATAVWALLSLPLVTAPAATVVLIHTVRCLSAGEPAPGLAESWRLARSYLGRALWLAALLSGGSLVVVSALLGPSPGAAWDVLLPVVVVPVSVSWFLACQWAFPLMAERDCRGWDALRYAYLRAIRRPDLSVLSGLGAVGLVVVALVLPATLWVVYWLTVPSAWALLVSHTSRRAACLERNAT